VRELVRFHGHPLMDGLARCLDARSEERALVPQDDASLPAPVPESITPSTQRRQDARFIGGKESDALRFMCRTDSFTRTRTRPLARNQCKPRQPTLPKARQ
jgi:hypothetical protein